MKPCRYISNYPGVVLQPDPRRHPLPARHRVLPLAGGGGGGQGPGDARHAEGRRRGDALHGGARGVRPGPGGGCLLSSSAFIFSLLQVGAPICLTCYSPVTLDHRCPDCGYPMCDDSCAAAESHRAECRVLRRGSRPVFSEGETEAYHCILPLRSRYPKYL